MTSLHDQCAAIGDQIRSLKRERTSATEQEHIDDIDSHITALNDARETLRGIAAFYELMNKVTQA